MVCFSDPIGFCEGLLLSFYTPCMDLGYNCRYRPLRPSLHERRLERRVIVGFEQAWQV